MTVTAVSCGRRTPRCWSGALAPCRAPRRDVVGDHAARSGVGPVADCDRRDEGRVDARLDARADRRAVLADPVVVGGEVAGADVRALPDVRVADVGQVRHLRAGADLGVLDLHERPRLGFAVQVGGGAQVGERPDRGSIVHARAGQVGVQDRHAVADLAVDQRAHRADHAVVADPRGAAQLHERLDDGVAPDRHRDVDRRRARVHDRHPAEHELALDAPLGDRMRVREVGAVVDAVGEVGVADRMSEHRLARLAQRGQHVGQVQLALGVVAVELLEHGHQRAAVERVDAGVDLADLQLLGRRVAGAALGLDHALHRAVGGPDHAAVGARVVELHRGHRRRGAGALVRLDERGDRLAGEQRHVAVDHHHGAGRADQRGGGRHGVTGAPGLLLDRDLDALGQMLGELALGIVDHDHPRGAGRPRGGNRPGDDRPPAQGMQDLGDCRAHAGPLARCEDHDGGIRHAGIVVSAQRLARGQHPMGGGVIGSTAGFGPARYRFKSGPPSRFPPATHANMGSERVPRYSEADARSAIAASGAFATRTARGCAPMSAVDR